MGVTLDSIHGGKRLELSHLLGRELHRQRRHVLAEVLHSGGAGNGADVAPLVVHPGQRELRRRASFPGSHGAHSLEYSGVLLGVLRLESW